MMNQDQRTEATKKLPEHLGQYVTVTYVDQMNAQTVIRGLLKGVDSYTNIEVTHLQRVPPEIQDMPIFQGAKLMKRVTGIPFLGAPDAIMSIVGGDGKVLYDNIHIHPGYNPYFVPHHDQNGNLRIGFDHEAGREVTFLTRLMSFGFP